MNYFIYFIVFIFGLIIGSAINCIVYRLHVKKSFFHGRSFCPFCKKNIHWYDNIPILSYLFLKAKCRFCKKPISAQYPIVELITALLFVLIFWVSFPDINNLFIFSLADYLILFRNWIFTLFLIIIFIYDLKYYLILDKVILPAVIISFLFNILIYMIKFESTALFSYILWLFIASFVAGGFFLLQFLISKGKWVGGGDIRLGTLMGFMLGWPQVLVALMISYISGSIIGIFLISTHKKTFQSHIPFGTFLALGTFIALLFGDKILYWYLNLTF